MKATFFFLLLHTRMRGMDKKRYEALARGESFAATLTEFV